MLSCSALTVKTTRQTNVNELVPASTCSIRPIMKSRREETVLTRLRIEHRQVNHAHLLRGDPSPACEYCQSQFATFSLHVHVMYLFAHVITVLII